MFFFSPNNLINNAGQSFIRLVRIRFAVLLVEILNSKIIGLLNSFLLIHVRGGIFIPYLFVLK